MRFIATIATCALLAAGSGMKGQITEKKRLSETRHQIYYASYSDDGSLIATTGSDNNIILWKAGSGNIAKTLAGSAKRPNAVQFSKDGEFLYSAGEDGLITAWDLSMVNPPVRTEGHTDAIKALAISPDGQILASGGEDHTLRIWSVSGQKVDLLYELKGHKRTITTLAFAPDGKSIVSGSADRTLIRWDPMNGTVTGQVHAHDGWIRCVKFNGEGTLIASGGDDRTIRIWNASDLSPVRTLTGHTDWVQSLDFTADGAYIISGGHDRAIRIWEVSSGTLLWTSEKLEEIVLSVDASPVARDLVSSCLDSEDLRIWGHNYGTVPVAQGSSGQPSGQSSTQIPLNREEMPRDQTGQVKEEPVEQVQQRTSIDSSGNQNNGAAATTGPRITLYSPEPVHGRVVHDQSKILILGKAEDPDGVQSFLVNRELVKLNSAGIFQVEVPLFQGDNPVDLVAISNRGKMTKIEVLVHCTDENALSANPGQRSISGGRYYALIIGINQYSDPDISDLDYPISDADSLYRTLLHKYSFDEDNITFLKNPDRSQMIIAMDELSRKITDNDNLLIFYAGHGYWDEKTGIGYWLPSDAARSNTANWFRNSTLRDFIGSIQSKHTLLIADACFSGSIFKTRSGFASQIQGIQKLHDLPSRKAMTSGALKEVPDKSVFVKYLIRELNKNQERFLPSEELYSNFKNAVLNNSPNVPQYGIIQNVGDEGGDFIFLRK